MPRLLRARLHSTAAPRLPTVRHAHLYSELAGHSTPTSSAWEQNLKLQQAGGQAGAGSRA